MNRFPCSVPLLCAYCFCVFSFRVYAQPSVLAWAPLGPRGTEISAFAALGSVLFAGVGTGGEIVYRSTDGGKTWERSIVNPSLGGNGFILRLKTAGNALFSVGYSYSISPDTDLYRSADSGKTWKRLFYPEFFPWIDLNVQDSTLYAQFSAVTDANFKLSVPYRSSDKGETWLPVPDLAAVPPIMALGAARVAVGTTGTLVRSTDGGKTWREATEGMMPRPWVMRSFKLAANARTLYVTGLDSTYNERLYRSSDTARLWKPVVLPVTSPPPVLINDVVALGDTIVAATSKGLFVSLDDGLRWSLESAFSGMSVTILSKEGSWLYAATNSGLYRTPLSSALTNVAVSAAASETLHIYPNPASGEVTARFSLQSRARVTLKAHTVLGAEAALVFEGELPAGEHIFRWDADKMPAGAYVMRLSADGRVVGESTVVIER